MEHRQDPRSSQSVRLVPKPSLLGYLAATLGLMAATAALT